MVKACSAKRDAAISYTVLTAGAYMKERVNNMDYITVIGAGLAGCEAAMQIAARGIRVHLIDMKPHKHSPAHSSDNFAELVCSNSLKAERIGSAAGLLKAEMKLLNSVCIAAAYQCKVPAGGALAVDRDSFSQIITDKIRQNDNIEIINEEVTTIPDGICVIATGPLTSSGLSDAITGLTGREHLSFYDAAAPIITADSIDMECAFYGSRYERGDRTDYINCPMDKGQYEAFYNELINAERAQLHSFDKVYEGCMPVEVMASRGMDTLRFGPLKPVGLRDPKTDHRPLANVQLRRENNAGSLLNLVGFQTNLKFSEQKRVFSMIPALKNAEFVRYGVMHRNTFINSPQLLQNDMSLKSNDKLFFAGQLTGVEGYMESAANGIIAGINAVQRFNGRNSFVLPNDTMIGALIGYITDESVANFQPMGANFGILPSLDKPIRDKKLRYEALAQRALNSFMAAAYANNIEIKELTV